MDWLARIAVARARGRFTEADHLDHTLLRCAGLEIARRYGLTDRFGDVMPARLFDLARPLTHAIFYNDFDTAERVYFALEDLALRLKMEAP